jgi:hypothetical protein
VEVLIRPVVFFIYYLHKKPVFEAGFSEINKRVDSNKICSWENFLKKNKKNSMLITDFRVRKRAFTYDVRCFFGHF